MHKLTKQKRKLKMEKVNFNTMMECLTFWRKVSIENKFDTAAPKGLDYVTAYKIGQAIARGDSLYDINVMLAD